MSWLNKLKFGLKKTTNKISIGITDIFTKKKLNQETLDELEELLITSDMGIDTSQMIVKELSKSKFEEEIDLKKIKEALADIIIKILEPSVGNLNFIKYKPHIILMCGVNGNGKTTSIGKIAAKYYAQGKKITMGACDTFRAAAQEQLQIWADRSKSTIVLGDLNSDPASVAYKSCEAAINNKSDVLLLDTAGRLANKSHLMEELAKINRVIKKQDETAPHDTILVLDATTGQNALKQLESFNNIVPITGIIITKLDGSAKAGIVVAIAHRFKIPIIAIGVGESINDLDSFKSKAFSRSLVGLRVRD